MPHGYQTASVDAYIHVVEHHPIIGCNYVVRFDGLHSFAKAVLRYAGIIRKVGRRWGMAVP
jgi:hypothetical protein